MFKRVAIVVFCLSAVGVLGPHGCGNPEAFRGDLIGAGGVRDAGPEGGQIPGSGGSGTGGADLIGTGGSGSGGTPGSGGSGSGGAATGGAGGTGGRAEGGRGGAGSGGMTGLGGSGSGGRAGSGGRGGMGGGGGSGSGGRGAGGAGTGGRMGGIGGAGGAVGGAGGPCAGLCSNPTVFNTPNYNSGNLGEMATCHQTTANYMGGNCGNFVAPRLLTINGTTQVMCGGQFSLPARRNGGYCLQTNAGRESYAYFVLF